MDELVPFFVEVFVRQNNGGPFTYHPDLIPSLFSRAFRHTSLLLLYPLTKKV